MRSTWKRCAIALAVLALAAGCAVAQDAEAQRMALLSPDASIEALAAAVESDDVLTARTAARLLPGKGADALPALAKALASEDVLVRRCAAMNLDKLGAAGLELAGKALGDENELVRQGAVFGLMRMAPTAETAALIEQAMGDESALVQRAAVQAGRSSYRTAEAIPLPKTGWLIRTDAEEVGVDQKWFAVDLDQAGWEAIEIEQFWGDQGPSPGVGWYRLTVALPDHEAPARTQLSFDAVDESTWVWVNGQFAGEHDLGPNGWDKPFRIDVTGKLKWGAENQITVRVFNTAMAGGIYKPVSIVLLEPAG